jgi:hypothetical protein
MATTSFPSVSQLKRALKVAEQLEALETELASIMAGSEKGSSKKPTAKPDGRKKKRTMSPEAREKIAAAQRKRWAKQKKTVA